MKKTILLLLALFCVSMSAQVLTVGSYNIRYQNNGDSIKGNGWQERYSVLCNQIIWEHPDIFGAQEVLYPQLQDILSILKDYKCIGTGRDDEDIETRPGQIVFGRIVRIGDAVRRADGSGDDFSAVHIIESHETAVR